MHKSKENIYEYLGLKDAADKKTRAAVLKFLLKDFREKGMTSEDVASQLGLDENQTEELLTGAIGQFSLDALVDFADKLGYKLVLPPIRCAPPLDTSES